MPEEAPEDAPIDGVSDLDNDLEDADTFPRDYVEKLRAESAKHRTRAKEYESAFEGYEPAERARYLELAAQLRDDPESAYEQFAGVTERLAKRLGKETIPVPEEAPAPDQEVSTFGVLTEADIDRIVGERLAAERAQTEQQSEVDRAFAEAEALGDEYKDKAAKAHLFAVAQHNNVDLAGAHQIIAEQRQELIDAAIEEYRQGLLTGKSHPPRISSGDPAAAPAAKGPPKTLDEARSRAEERLGALYGG